MPTFFSLGWALSCRGVPTTLLFSLVAPPSTDPYDTNMASLPLDSRAMIDDTRQASVYGFGIAFMITTTFVILLRMYVRVFMTKAVGAEDSKWRTKSPGVQFWVWLT